MDRIWLFILKFEARMCRKKPSHIETELGLQSLLQGQISKRLPSCSRYREKQPGQYPLHRRIRTAVRSSQDVQTRCFKVSRSELGKSVSSSGVSQWRGVSLARGPEIHGGSIGDRADALMMIAALCVVSQKLLVPFGAVDDG